MEMFDFQLFAEDVVFNEKGEIFLNFLYKQFYKHLKESYNLWIIFLKIYSDEKSIEPENVWLLF